MVAGNNFAFALGAQFLLSTVNSTALIASSTVAEVWFPPEELVLSTTLTSVANFVGVGVGLIWPPYIDDIWLQLIIEAGIGVCVCLAYAVLGRKEIKRAQRKMTWGDTKTFLKRGREMAVLFMCGSGIGVSYTLISLLQQILLLDGYTYIQSGWAGFVLVIGGMLGGLVATAIVAKWKTYIIPLRIYIALAVVMTIIQCVVLDLYPLYLCASFCLGVGLIGFVPLAISMGVEAAFPLDEAIPTNVLFTSAQLFSLAYTYPVWYFQDGTGKTGLWAVAVCTTISFVPLFLFCNVKKEKSRTSDESQLSALEQMQEVIAQ